MKITVLPGEPCSLKFKDLPGGQIFKLEQTGEMLIKIKKEFAEYESEMNARYPARRNSVVIGTGVSWFIGEDLEILPTMMVDEVIFKMKG